MLSKTEFSTCATRLHGTVQILLHIAELFAVQKFVLLLESRVNERRIRARFSVQKFVRTSINGAQQSL